MEDTTEKSVDNTAEPVNAIVSAFSAAIVKNIKECSKKEGQLTRQGHLSRNHVRGGARCRQHGLVKPFTFVDINRVPKPHIWDFNQFSHCKRGRI